MWVCFAGRDESCVVSVDLDGGSGDEQLVAARHSDLHSIEAFDSFVGSGCHLGPPIAEKLRAAPCSFRGAYSKANGLLVQATTTASSPCASWLNSTDCTRKNQVVAVGALWSGLSAESSCSAR